MAVETKDVETVSLEERDPVVYPVDSCIVSRTSQGGRILLNCIDPFVATQCERNGIPTYSCEAIQHDNLVVGLGRGNVSCDLAALGQNGQVLAKPDLLCNAFLCDFEPRVIGSPYATVV